MSCIARAMECAKDAKHRERSEPDSYLFRRLPRGRRSRGTVSVVRSDIQKDVGLYPEDPRSMALSLHASSGLEREKRTRSGKIMTYCCRKPRSEPAVTTSCAGSSISCSTDPTLETCPPTMSRPRRVYGSHPGSRGKSYRTGAFLPWAIYRSSRWEIVDYLSKQCQQQRMTIAASTTACLVGG